MAEQTLLYIFNAGSANLLHELHSQLFVETQDDSDLYVKTT